MGKIVRLILFALLFVSCNSHGPLVTIGISTDMHYAPDSEISLREAIDTFNARSTDFNVFLGDFVSGAEKHDLKVARDVSSVLSLSESPVYCILGESDFVSPYGTPVQDSLMRLLKVEKPYYSIDFGGFRFIFLDSNDNSTYSRPKGSNEWRYALDNINALWGEGAPYGKPFNGSLGADQYGWLKDLLADSCAKQQKVIVFSHQPFALPYVTHNQLDGKMMLELFSNNPCVKACFSGHHHMGAMTTSGGVHNFVFKSFGGSPDCNFAILKLYKDRIEVEGFGSQPGATLDLR